jgi:hypothetical protein
MSDGELVPRSQLKFQDLIDRMGITLVPLENFRVEVKFPIDNPKSPVSMYLDGFLIRKGLCNCPSQTLLTLGCQCGGI